MTLPFKVIYSPWPISFNLYDDLLQASDAYHFFTSGQSKIQQGLLRDGYELISEALNLLNNVYGPMHAEIAACLRLLARLNYIMGEYGEVTCLMFLYDSKNIRLYYDMDLSLFSLWRHSGVSFHNNVCSIWLILHFNTMILGTE